MSEVNKTQVIQDKLNLSLKEIYTLSMKADEQLDALKQEEKGNFSSIFQPESGFKARSNRFLPYLIEVSEEVGSLPDTDSERFSGALKELLKKIHRMHQILNHFHSIS